MSAVQINASEMSDTQIREALEHMTGLPCPQRGDRDELEQWAKWEVASNIFRFVRENENPLEATRLAVEYTLRNHASPVEHLIPQIETAIGRRLTGAELQSGTLA